MRTDGLAYTYTPFSAVIEQIGTQKGKYRYLHLIGKESRCFFTSGSSYQHRRYLMADAKQDLPKRNSLRQVPPAFALHDEKYLHSYWILRMGLVSPMGLCRVELTDEKAT